MYKLNFKDIKISKINVKKTTKYKFKNLQNDQQLIQCRDGFRGSWLPQISKTARDVLEVGNKYIFQLPFFFLYIQLINTKKSEEQKNKSHSNINEQQITLKKVNFVMVMTPFKIISYSAIIQCKRTNVECKRREI